MTLHPTEMMATSKMFETGKLTAILRRLNMLHTTPDSSFCLTTWTRNGNDARTRRAAICMATLVTDMTTWQLLFTEIPAGMRRQPRIERRILFLSTVTKILVRNV